VAARAILLFALGAFLLPVIGKADGAPTLPSRKASVVIPLLKAFSPKAGDSRITQILGKEDLDAGNALNDRFYALDNGDNVRVRSDGDKVYSIFLQVEGTVGIQVIYALDKTWDH
jgi:hypothetical protein